MIRLKVYVAGHNGMVGSALVRLLKSKKGVDLIIKNKSELDLINQDKVENFFKKEKIDQVYIAAAKVGGIYANSIYPADFIYKNLQIQSNIIHSAFISGTKKLLFLGSSCIYPKFANQPIKEEELLTGSLESTNEPYAIAKIAGLKMCESYNKQYGKSHNIDYRSVMPTNLYGPGDNYDLKNSHVIPALIRKFHEAKIKKKLKVIIWGTGKQRREFLHVDDLAKACFLIMNLKHKILIKNFNDNYSHINIGFGSDLSIEELAKIIKKITNYSGKIEFNSGKAEGTKTKLLDSKRIFNLGWRPEVLLEEGLKRIYQEFKNNYENNFKNI
jgi:GDP-L-fucose synthase